MTRSSGLLSSNSSRSARDNTFAFSPLQSFSMVLSLPWKSCSSSWSIRCNGSLALVWPIPIMTLPPLSTRAALWNIEHGWLPRMRTSLIGMLLKQKIFERSLLCTVPTCHLLPSSKNPSLEHGLEYEDSRFCAMLLVISRITRLIILVSLYVVSTTSTSNLRFLQEQWLPAFDSRLLPIKKYNTLRNTTVKLFDINNEYSHQHHIKKKDAGPSCEFGVIVGNNSETSIRMNRL